MSFRDIESAPGTHAVSVLAYRGVMRPWPELNDDRPVGGLILGTFTHLSRR